MNPIDVTQALAKGARLHGVRIFEGVKVVDVHSGLPILRDPGRCAYIIEIGYQSALRRYRARASLSPLYDPAGAGFLILPTSPWSKFVVPFTVNAWGCRFYKTM